MTIDFKEDRGYKLMMENHNSKEYWKLRYTCTHPFTEKDEDGKCKNSSFCQDHMQQNGGWELTFKCCGSCAWSAEDRGQKKPLLPCPFCDGKEIDIIKQEAYSEAGFNNAEEYFAGCGLCGCRTGYEMTEQDAANAWNWRRSEWERRQQISSVEQQAPDATSDVLTESSPSKIIVPYTTGAIGALLVPLHYANSQKNAGSSK